MSVQQLLPSGGATDNTANGSPRVDKYQEAWVQPTTASEEGAALEGSYFTAISGLTPGVPGTGIIGHAAAQTFDETKPYLLVYNGGPYTLIPKVLQLYCTVVGTTGTRVQLTVTRDVGTLSPTGGTAASIQNTNSEGGPSASGISITQGAVVAAAATSSRVIIGNFAFRGTIEVVEDFYQLVWGAPDGVGGSASRAATVADFSRVVPPMAIGPGKCMKIHQWRAAQTVGITFEMVFGFKLR